MATVVSELPRLRKLEERGRQNGLKGVRWLEPAEIRKIEPHCAGLAALHVPEEGIIDYRAVCRSLASDIELDGGRIQTGFEVESILRRKSAWVLRSGKSEVTADFIVGCAGLQSDRVAKLSGEDPEVKIIPFRGEYFKLR